MAEVLTPGAVGEAQVVVTPETTAERFGNAGAAVFATPMLVALCEQAAIKAVAPYLLPGQGTVGTHIELNHLAATPVGLRVTARAVLIEVAGKRLVFSLEAWDERETVGRGRHERYIIDRDRFLARAQAKTDGR